MRSALHWITVSIGLIAFLLFVVQLRHSPQAFVQRHATAREVPKSGVLRDGQLSVTVVVRNIDDEGDEPTDAGASPLRPRVARAVVHAYWQREREFLDAGTASTNTEGVAVLSALPRGVVWLLAEAPGFARASTQLVVEGGTRSVSLGLELAHSLEVAVSDEQGQPLKRATVLVNSRDFLPFGALTGEDAVARFTRLGKPPWKVKASAPGYESVTRTAVTGDLSMTLRRLGALIVRVERASGGAAVNAQVDIAGSTLWPARSVRTDAHGNALIRGLLAGSFDLRATLDTEVSRTELGVTLARGEEREVVLRLLPGRFATLRVTDGEAENAPAVPDAAVVIAESGLASFPLRGRTGPLGTVRLGPIAPGPATATASAADFVGGAPIAVPEEIPGELRIALVRGATLRGRVVDVHDHVIPGASIEIVGTDQTGLPIAETPALRALRSTHFDWSMAAGTPLLSIGELGVMPGPIPAIPGAAAGISDWVLPGTETLLGGASSSSVGQNWTRMNDLEPWVTRSDGTFHAHPVTPGRVRAIVRHPEFVEGISEAVLLLPGAEGEVKVVLHEGGRIEGRVVDNRDFPVPGARVDLAALKGTTARTTVTADDGSFAFAAVPLEITLTVERPQDDAQRLAVRRSVVLHEGKRETVVIVLPAAREPVQVAVADDRGQPLENVEIQVSSLLADVPMKRTAFTDADGHVAVPDAQGLPLRVRADLPGFVAVSQNYPEAAAKLQVILHRGVALTGRITAVRGRQNVDHAQVTVLSQGQRRTVTTDSDGKWQLRDVAPGTVRVSVQHPDYCSVEIEATAVATGRDDRPYEVPTIDLPDAGEVSGRVLDMNGKPVPGARVAPYVAPSYLALGELPATLAMSSADGSFHLRGITPGKTTIYALAPTMGRGSSAPVEVIAGREQRDVIVRLDASAEDDAPNTAGAGVAITLGEKGGEIQVVAVAPASEAERAGVVVGDSLIAIEGVAPASISDARSRLFGPEGTDVLVELRHAGSPVRLRVAREPLRR